MDKHEVAAILEDIGILLDLKGENPFKSRAYMTGARIVESLQEDLAALVSSGGIRSIKGIGPTLAEKITTLVTTGSLPYHAELRASLPAGLLEFLRIPGLGPKRAKALYDALGVDSLAALEEACRAGKLRDIPGFGEKSETNLLAGLAHLKTSGERVLYPEARAEADRLLALIRSVPGVTRAEIAGSLRRHRETVKDIDIVCAAPASAASRVMERFTSYPGVVAIVARGDTKSSVRLSRGLNVDLRVVSTSEFVPALAYFTGSKEHNVALRGRALKRGFKLNEYGLFRDEKPVRLADEAALYRALGLAYIPPELRENHGEIEAAERGPLPRLVELGDLRGALHVHSTWSDGTDTLDDMVNEAERLGFEYLGMTEHSTSAYYAGGLKPDRLLQYLDELDRLNAQPGRRVRILKGSECDIRADGSLDYDLELLARLDFVVASVHSRFKMDREAMTARIVAAVRNPFTTILGHPTGRLLLRREPYAVDLEAVIAEAAAHGVAVEINAHPSRLDADWRMGRALRAAGARVSIDPDAHATEGYGDIAIGVGIARKAGMTAADVLNALPLDKLLAHLDARKEKALATVKKPRTRKKAASQQETMPLPTAAPRVRRLSE
jgi:DNA polymerase (family 10)